jgi:hypothetical protein
MARDLLQKPKLTLVNSEGLLAYYPLTGNNTLLDLTGNQPILSCVAFFFRYLRPLMGDEATLGQASATAFIDWAYRLLFYCSGNCHDRLGLNTGRSPLLQIRGFEHRLNSRP